MREEDEDGTGELSSLSLLYLFQPFHKFLVVYRMRLGLQGPMRQRSKENR